MPVRRIPKNYVSVTGRFASCKNGRALGFESLLERDYMLLLEFDDEVVSFEEQPVQIAVPKGDRRAGTQYVPDVLVHYKPSPDGTAKPSVLAEVKKTSDLKVNAAKYAAKFAAATSFAEGRGWVFRTVSELEIRTPRLENLKFLREFRLAERDPKLAGLILSGLSAVGIMLPISVMIDELFPTESERLNGLPVLWQMIASNEIGADLDQPLNNESMIWSLRS